jgi:hypothetical protein
MALFTRDIHNRFWRYTSNRDGFGAQKGWVDVAGDFKEANKKSMEEGLEFFHANDFEDFAPYVAARRLLFDIMEVYLDQGVVTPSGDFYGVRPGKHEAFVEALGEIKARLPDRLERQVHSYGIGTPWLGLSQNETKPIPSDASKAQIETLEQIGYKDGEQINYDGRFYRTAFTDGDNPAMNELINVCFDLLDEYDLYAKNNKAIYAALQMVAIENDFNL